MADSSTLIESFELCKGDCVLQCLQRLEQLSNRLDQYEQKIDRLLERLERDDARHQNALIRSHAPVPAFRQHTTPTTSFFNLAPDLWFHH